MKSDELKEAIEQLKQFARNWNELYASEKFEEMKLLATEDIGIANAPKSSAPSGLIFGRQAYYNGIHDAYVGKSGKDKNLLTMEYEGWEYIPLGDNNTFLTIGRYSLQPDMGGVNCWLIRRECPDSPWQIFRVINT